MATKETTTEKERDLQEEFDKLKTQVSDLASLLKEQGQQRASNVKSDLGDQVAEYEEKLKEQVAHAKDLGNENLEKVSCHVKEKPIASLLVAFGVGYVISKTLGHK